MKALAKKTLTSKKQKIHTFDIRLIKKIREEKKELESKLTVLKSSLEDKEETVISALENGCIPEVGCPLISIAIRNAVRPKWKEVFLDYEGEQEVKKVIQNTPVSTTKKLVIL